MKILWEREKLLVPTMFSTHSASFIKSKIVVCKLLSVWKSLKFVVCEWFNTGLAPTDCLFFFSFLQADVQLAFPVSPATKPKEDRYAKKPEIKVF